MCEMKMCVKPNKVKKAILTYLFSTDCVKMVDEDWPSEKELRHWEEQQQKMWEEEYERYIAGQNENNLNYMSSNIQSCISQTNENHMYELNQTFKAWYRLFQRYNVFIEMNPFYPEALCLADVSIAITENVYDSIFATVSGRYKLALVSLRTWLEQYLKALYFSIELRNNSGDGVKYNEIKHEYDKWVKGDKTKMGGKRVTGEGGIINKVITPMNEIISLNAPVIGMEWLPKEKTLETIVEDIYKNLSEVIHLGMEGEIDIGFKRPLNPFTYIDYEFINWYDHFRKIDDITTLLILLYYPGLVEFDDSKWTESFQFNKEIIKSIHTKNNAEH